MHADHLKLMFPMAWTLSTMAWTILDGRELLQQQQFDGRNNLQWGVKTLEYGLSFLLDCAFDDGEFVYQVRQPPYYFFP
jgi:Glycosyl hydrolase family 9